jgi:ubiquinone/menaquinone biosynthesis C-methylase UbiE
LGPAALFRSIDNKSNHVLLAVGKANMAKLDYQDESIDAIVNRGSIFYLAYDQIEACIAEMHRTLRPGGRLLLTLKSNSDSRFSSKDCITVNKWRRRQTMGAQRDLEMEFFDLARAEKVISKFKIMTGTHIVTSELYGDSVFADYSFVLEK